jgi:hypothetical protein
MCQSAMDPYGPSARIRPTLSPPPRAEHRHLAPRLGETGPLWPPSMRTEACRLPSGPEAGSCDQNPDLRSQADRHGSLWRCRLRGSLAQNFGTPDSVTTLAALRSNTPLPAGSEEATMGVGSIRGECRAMCRTNSVSWALPSSRAGTVIIDAPQGAWVPRSPLNDARISEVNSSGSSQAAKWPPFSASLKYVTLG